MMQLSIGIAGAGIGGLAAGALLAKDGHRVVIYDQFDQPRPVGSGLVIQPVGQAVLTAVGADDAIARGAHVDHMLGHEADSGRVVLDVSYTLSGAHRFGLAIHRATLFDALYQAALHAGVEIVPSHAVSGCETGAKPSLLFKSGQRSATFDLVIDSSGAASPLSPLRARALPYGAIWGTVPWPADTSLPYSTLRQRYRRASNMVGVLPLGELPGRDGPHAAIFWSLPVGQLASWSAGGVAAWQDETAALWPDFAPFAAQVSAPSDMTSAQYSHGTLRRPYADGLAIIGDAAHRASPQLGQGANMALLDAFALARALRTHPVANALPAYAKARRWHVRSYQIMSALFTPMYQSDSRALPVLRDRLLTPASRVPPVPRFLSHLVCGTMLPPVWMRSAGLSVQ